MDHVGVNLHESSGQVCILTEGGELSAIPRSGYAVRDEATEAESAPSRLRHPEAGATNANCLSK